jgi:hypothetical protein
LSGAQVHHTVGDHDIGPGVWYGQLLDVTLSQLNVRNPCGRYRRTSAIEHVRRHVDSYDSARGTHHARRDQRVELSATPHVDDPLSGGKFAGEEWVPGSSEGGESLNGHISEPLRVVAEEIRERPPGMEVKAMVRLPRDQRVLLLDRGAKLLAVDGGWQGFGHDSSSWGIIDAFALAASEPHDVADSYPLGSLPLRTLRIEPVF